MTTTVTAKTTNFKLMQPEIVAKLLPIFQQIDELRQARALDQPKSSGASPDTIPPRRGGCRSEL